MVNLAKVCAAVSGVFLVLVAAVLFFREAAPTDEELVALRSAVEQHQKEHATVAERVRANKLERQDLARFLMDPAETLLLYDLVKLSVTFEKSQVRQGLAATAQNTVSVQQCMGKAIKDLSLESIMQLWAADASWQNLIPGIDDVMFYGTDVNWLKLEEAKRRHAGRPNFVFKMYSPHLPLRLHVDLVLVRNAFESLPTAFALQSLKALIEGESKYIAMSTWPGSTEKDNNMGYNTPAGGYYKPNLRLPPFNFPEPLFMCDNVDEGQLFRGQQKLGFWKANTLVVTGKMVADAKNTLHEKVPWDAAEWDAMLKHLGKN